MSWYVKQILLNKDNIRGSVIGLQDNEILSFDYDRDDYLDLLSVEKAIDELTSKNLFSKIELIVLSSVSDGMSFMSLGKTIHIPRANISRTLNVVTDKIAFYLGGHFSNEGYMAYFKSKYNLNTDQVKHLTDIIYGDTA